MNPGLQTPVAWFNRRTQFEMDLDAPLSTQA
jgi:hypothetical protein